MEMEKRNGIGPDSIIKLVLDLIAESDQAVRAVHSSNSWLILLLLFSRRISLPGEFID